MAPVSEVPWNCVSLARLGQRRLMLPRKNWTGSGLVGAEALASHVGLNAWFDGPLGKAVSRSAVEKSSELIPRTYYPTGLQLGPGPEDFLSKVDIGLAIYSPSVGMSNPQHVVTTASEALPFSARSIELLVLPHTLDFANEPHVALREASLILAAEGILVVCGFNRWSLWGLRRAVTPHPRPSPWSGDFLSPARVQDWMRLLGLEILGGKMMFYQLPVSATELLRKTDFLEKAGDRWWPLLGGIYLLVARKKRLGLAGTKAKMARHRPFGIDVMANTIPRQTKIGEKGL
jgi:hypothetical protein